MPFSHSLEKTRKNCKNLQQKVLEDLFSDFDIIDLDRNLPKFFEFQHSTGYIGGIGSVTWSISINIYNFKTINQPFLWLFNDIRLSLIIVGWLRKSFVLIATRLTGTHFAEIRVWVDWIRSPPRWCQRIMFSLKLWFLVIGPGNSGLDLVRRLCDNLPWLKRYTVMIVLWGHWWYKNLKMVVIFPSETIKEVGVQVSRNLWVINFWAETLQ